MRHLCSHFIRAKDDQWVRVNGTQVVECRAHASSVVGRCAQMKQWWSAFGVANRLTLVRVPSQTSWHSPGISIVEFSSQDSVTRGGRTRRREYLPEDISSSTNAAKAQESADAAYRESVMRIHQAGPSEVCSQ